MLVGFGGQLPRVINVPETFGNPPGIGHSTLAGLLRKYASQKQGLPASRYRVGQQAGIGMFAALRVKCLRQIRHAGMQPIMQPSICNRTYATVRKEHVRNMQGHQCITPLLERPSNRMALIFR
jgi:hypothetical protein